MVFLDGDEFEHTAYSSIQETTSNARYTPYNPNYVATNEGYRIEMPENNVSYPEQNGDFINRIPNPSHYPLAYAYQNIDRIPNPSHYPLLSDNQNINDFSDNIGMTQNDIEPSRSQIRNEGYYYGNDHQDSQKVEYIPPRPSFSQRIRNKCERLDKHLTNDYIEHKKRVDQVDQARLYRKELKQRLRDQEIYLKGSGRLTQSEIWKLNSEGFKIQNKKIMKR